MIQPFLTLGLPTHPLFHDGEDLSSRSGVTDCCRHCTDVASSLVEFLKSVSFVSLP